jgi:hypothetical protein
MADEEPQERFQFAVLSPGALMEEVEVDFKDGKVLLPEWLIEACGYWEMPEAAVKEFRAMCARVRYDAFRQTMQGEANTLERAARRRALNDLQARIVSSWQEKMARARMILAQMQRGRWPR